MDIALESEFLSVTHQVEHDLLHSLTVHQAGFGQAWVQLTEHLQPFLARLEPNEFGCIVNELAWVDPFCYELKLTVFDLSHIVYVCQHIAEVFCRFADDSVEVESFLSNKARVLRNGCDERKQRRFQFVSS